MIKKVLILILIVSLCACYRTSYKFTLDKGSTFRSSYWNNYFVYGLIPVKDSYSYEELCNNGKPARLDTKVDGANFLATIFSLGLSSANNLTVECISNNTLKKASTKL